MPSIFDGRSVGTTGANLSAGVLTGLKVSTLTSHPCDRWLSVGWPASFNQRHGTARRLRFCQPLSQLEPIRSLPASNQPHALLFQPPLSLPPHPCTPPLNILLVSSLPTWRVDEFSKGPSHLAFLLAYIYLGVAHTLLATRSETTSRRFPD